MKTKLYVALDFSSEGPAAALVQQLKGFDVGFKVGLELFTAVGSGFVQRLVGDGLDVFLDLKFHDIPNTVAGAVASASRLGVEFTSIHIVGGEAMVRQAAATAKKSDTKVLGITALTSVDQETLLGVGIDQDPAKWVPVLAKQAKAWGLDGIVCSPQEIANVKKACGKDFITMVPGIRLGNDTNDQKRVASPAEARKFGADYIVVGRPITHAENPVEALERFLVELK